MVREVIKEVKPNYVVLELCDARLDNLIEQEPVNITLLQVIKESISQKSFKTLGMGLLIWMQVKAANIMGNKLGGELAMGAKEGALQKSVLVLGDRQYSVTIQRVFDKLNLLDKIRMAFILIWEVFTMSIFKLKDYISKTENDENFIEGEIQKFKKYLPVFADIIINERDEYIAQTICEIARVGFNRLRQENNQLIGKIVVIVGAGHLKGLQKWLSLGGISAARLNEISLSSKHTTSCWPGQGMLSVFQYPLDSQQSL
jgi:pheromone shutdown protein TraB